MAVISAFKCDLVISGIPRKGLPSHDTTFVFGVSLNFLYTRHASKHFITLLNTILEQRDITIIHECLWDVDWVRSESLDH